MTQSESPEHHLVRTALQRRGVSGRSLEAVMDHFEKEGQLHDLAQEVDDDQRRDYIDDHLVDFGTRLARSFEEYGDVASDGRETVVQHHQPDGLAEGHLWLLLQQLVIEDVRNWPPVRGWRRQHLGGPDAVLTHEEVEPWILKNTTDWDRGSPHSGEPGPFIWHLFGDPLVRDVPEDSPVYSLRELAKSLADTTGWHERDATIWVLTDRLPPAQDASVSFKHRQFGLTPTVVLEVSAWLSARQVARHYRFARRQVLIGRRPSANRKVLEMARFVLDNPTLSWEDRWREWNATHPDSPYTSKAAMKRMYFGLLRKLQSARGPRLRRLTSGRPRQRSRT